jgi:hypothetical protein
MNKIALRQWFVCALILAAGARGALAQGLVCQQACTSGVCLQSECALPAAGGGSCFCGSGAVPLSGGTYAAYCRSWGQPQPGCGQALPVSSVMTPPSPQLPAGSVMATPLFSQNPFVAVLIGAIQDGNGNWANAPVGGLIHDIYYDSGTGALAEGTAVPFSAATPLSQGGVTQIEITVQGDLGQLAWLTQYSATAAPTAIAPISILGVVSGGGSHGSLLVSGKAGQSQTVQW